MTAEGTNRRCSNGEAMSENPHPGASRPRPLRLRGQAYPLITLEIGDPSCRDLDRLLDRKVAQAPAFFRNAAVVLDFTPAGSRAGECDPGEIAEQVRRAGLNPVAVRARDAETERLATQAGLARLPVSHARDARFVAGFEAVHRPPLVITEPVRSGQTIHAAGSDLVVVASVSSGAEILADGSIHVYGALRGRALAGLADDANARIFAGAMEAELVSVAGLYLTADDIPGEWRGRRTQVVLQDGFLSFSALA